MRQTGTRTADPGEPGADAGPPDFPAQAGVAVRDATAPHLYNKFDILLIDFIVEDPADSRTNLNGKRDDT
jgi:hypothetical protein